MQGGIFETSSSLGPVEWKLGGNSFGAPGVIGTLDAQPFVFYAGGSERARFLSSGNFGIGTTTPDTTLHVAGSFKLVDGTQALGYVLTSDAAGLASWEPGPGAVVNELDPVIQQQNSPPGGPTTGDRYLVGTAPTGAWVGSANKIAEWDGATWIYTTPVNDDVVYIINAGAWKRFNGVAWVAYAGTVILQNGNSLATNVIIGSINSKALQFKTNNVLRGQFLNTGNFAITNNSFFGGSASATARVHIRGIDDLSGSYSVKVENQSVSSLFSIMNNGYIGAGILLPLYPFHINTTLDSNESLMVQSTASQAGITIKGAQYPFLNFFSGATQQGQLAGSPTGAFILRYNDNFVFQRFTGNVISKVDNSNNWYFANPNPDTFTASARVHIQGFDTTGSNYALKVDNSASSPILYAQNNQWVGVKQASQVGTEVFYVNGYSTLNGRVDINGDIFINGSGFSKITSPANDFIGTFAGGFQFTTLSQSLINTVIDGAGGNQLVFLNSIASFKTAGSVDTTVYYVMTNNTAPTVDAASVNSFKMYSADIVAGNAAPHFLTENGDLVKLFKGAALTTALTTVTFSAPGTPDYAIQDLTAGGFGFVTADEGQTFVSVVANLQARVNELELRLQASGQLT